MTSVDSISDKTIAYSVQLEMHATTWTFDICHSPCPATLVTFEHPTMAVNTIDIPESPPKAVITPSIMDLVDPGKQSTPAKASYLTSLATFSSLETPDVCVHPPEGERVIRGLVSKPEQALVMEFVFDPDRVTPAEFIMEPDRVPPDGDIDIPPNRVPPDKDPEVPSDRVPPDKLDSGELHTSSGFPNPIDCYAVDKNVISYQHHECSYVWDLMDDQKHVVYVEGEQSGDKVNLCDSLAQQWKERNRRNKTLVVEHLVQATTLDLASSDSTDCKHCTACILLGRGDSSLTLNGAGYPSSDMIYANDSTQPKLHVVTCVIVCFLLLEQISTGMMRIICLSRSLIASLVGCDFSRETQIKQLLGAFEKVCEA